VRRAVFLALLGIAACSGKPAPDAGFAGTWVMNVDGRPFMVLTLKPQDTHYVGTLEMPKHMSTDGLTFSGVSRESTTKPAITAAPQGDRIRITTKPQDKSDEADEFDFTLTTTGEARIKIPEAPFDPWPFTRYAGTDPLRVWDGWDARRSYALQPPYVAPNPEMAAIYKADQAFRQSQQSFEASAKQIEKDDAARREQVRALIDTGQLRAGEDFRLAAMVFQHGGEPRDYLFAHTLALIAMRKGDVGASWIAAASLDRYLRSIDRQQVFGLQFKPGGAERQPFDDTLLSDALRLQLGIPTLAEQTAQMQQFVGK